MDKCRRKTVAIIPARANSIGLPNKNLLSLDGTPLWRLAVNQGCRTADMTIFTSNLPEISQEDMPQSVRFLRRPDELAGGDVPMAKVVQHVIDTCALCDATLILLQPTSPFRADKDVLAALQLHMKADYEMIVSLTRSDRSILKHGSLEGEQFVPVSNPNLCFANRQELPDIYKPNGAVYVFDTTSFQKSKCFPADRMGGIVMPAERSLDIDTAADFLLAQNIASENRDHS